MRTRNLFFSYFIIIRCSRGIHWRVFCSALALRSSVRRLPRTQLTCAHLYLISLDLEYLFLHFAKNRMEVAGQTEKSAQIERLRASKESRLTIIGVDVAKK